MRHYKTSHYFKKYGETQAVHAYKMKGGGFKVDVNITFPVNGEPTRESWELEFPRLTHPSPTKFARITRDVIYERIQEINNNA